jgi:hypothetical protein
MLRVVMRPVQAYATGDASTHPRKRLGTFS